MAKQPPAARTAPKPRNPQVARPITAQHTPPALPPRNPKPVAKDNPIKVRATRLGYYDHIRRREGDVFVIANEQAFSHRWMERVDARTAERTSTARDAIQRAHDEILGGSTTASPARATGDADVLGE